MIIEFIYYIIHHSNIYNVLDHTPYYMIQREVLEIIEPYNLWRNDIDIGIWRDNYVNHILNAFKVPNIAILITGVRRAGKTYICKQILRKWIETGKKSNQTLYINFEDPAIQPYLTETFLQNLYETYRHYLNPKDDAVIVLDEVQNLPAWEKWVRRFLEINENAKIIITGSSSKLMSLELSTVLTGRFINFRIFPLSFFEFLRFKQVPLNNFNIQINKMENELREFLEFGGFPTVVLTPDFELQREYMKDTFDSIITRDIVTRFGIRKIHELKSTVVLLLRSVAALVSVPKLEKNLKSIGIKISPTTINQYLHYLNESLLFYYVPIYAYKVKDQMQYPKKLYCIDTGLLNAVSFRTSENIGKLAENIVAIELFRRYGTDNIFYWKSKDGKEIDFVIVRGDQVENIIQVAWTISDKKTKSREVKALSNAMDKLKVKNALLITSDPELKLEQNIKHVSILKWLLTGNILNS